MTSVEFEKTASAIAIGSMEHDVSQVAFFLFGLLITPSWAHPPQKLWDGIGVASWQLSACMQMHGDAGMIMHVHACR